jgi:hypothetical protein
MGRSYTEAQGIEPPAGQNIPRNRYDEDVMHMNGACAAASGWVQRAPPSVVGLIDRSGHPTGSLAIGF